MEELILTIANNPALLLAAIAWSVAWKGAAMWRAARNGSKPWFVALLLVNSLGLLDALYLFVFSRIKESDPGLSNTP